MHIASTNTHKDCVTFLNFDIDPFLTELVNTFRLPQKHNVHLLSFRESVNVVSERLIDLVILLGYIDGLSLLHHLVDI